MLPNLPGGAGRGLPATGPFVAVRQTDCRGTGAVASPLSPSAGGEASRASWNDIGRSANQARGCSWSCHVQEETHTRLGRAPPPVWKGLCKCTFLSMHLRGFTTVLRTGPSFVKSETKPAGPCLPALAFALLPDKCTEPREAGPWGWRKCGEESLRSPIPARSSASPGGGGLPAQLKAAGCTGL